MACAVVGSPEMKLENTFRMMMALKIAENISLQECRKLAYISGCIDDQVVLPYHPNFRLHVLMSLESHGLISPTKLDFLEDVLKNLGRNDLLDVIQDYKKTREYKKMMKHHKKLTRRKQTCDGGSGAATTLLPADKDQYEKLHAHFLTQFSRLSLSTRAALESNDFVRIKSAFSKVAADAQKLSHTVRKTTSEIDLQCICSSSSGESSGK